MYGHGIEDVIFMMILFGVIMMLIGHDVRGDSDSPLIGVYGMMLCSFGFLLLYTYIFPPNNAPPTWEEVRPWYIAHYRGW